MRAIIPAMRGAGGLLCVAFLAVVAALSAGAATAATTAGPPSGWSDFAPMALASADFPGSHISAQGYVQPDSASLGEYDRTIMGAKIAGKKTYVLENDLDLFKRVGDADLIVTALPLGLRLQAASVAKQFAKETGLKITYTKVGKPQSLGVGNNSVAIVLHMGTKKGEIRLVFGVVRIGSLDSFIVFAGLPKAQLGVSHAKQLARTSATRIKTKIVPQSTVVPAITGTPAVGQTLSTSTGTWLNFPVTYTYQWARCDSAGANCAPIPNATAQNYVVSADDAGFTLEVTVGAANVYGTATAASTPTAAVPPVIPPPPGP
jgi:hypothetical protein